MKRKKIMSEHHRRCRSHGGKSTTDNISVVTKVTHDAYHVLFANKTPKEIAKILTDVWIDPAFKMVAIKK